ncbi:MAG: cell division protein FtsZ, partial [Candidatus Margulisiibacteriota bacterium]
GENRAVDAAEAAIQSPLLEETITGAKGVIFNVTGGSDLTLYEVNEAAEVIYNAVDPDANIIFGAVIDEKLQGDVVVTVIATGFVPSTKKEKEALPFIRPRSARVSASPRENIELPPFMR